MEKSECEVVLHSCDFTWEEHAQACKHALFRERNVEIPDTDLEKISREKWETFHQLNKGKIYKNRNYLLKEFPELQSKENTFMKVLEIGCGYGSSIFPILSRSDSLYADVCDFSSQAIQILMSNPLYDPLRCRAFVCDIVKDPLNLPQDSFDAVLLIFALSALAPASLPSVVEKIRDVLKPGGVVCFRDYGLFDLAMMRNAKCISSSVYYRSDGTIAHFFSIEDIEGLFNTESGFKVVENKYCTVRLQNRKNGKLMDRVWLHAKIRKCL